MASITQTYGTSTAMTLTLASLASSATAGRESTAVDNSSSNYIDAIVGLKVTLANTAPGSDQAVYVYAYGSEDGTNFTDNASGSDAAITLRSPSNTVLIGVMKCPTQNVAYIAQFSIAQAFGGILPRKWGIIVRNYTNVTFSATAGDHFAKYTGITMTVA